MLFGLGPVLPVGLAVGLSALRRRFRSPRNKEYKCKRSFVSQAIVVRQNEGAEVLGQSSPISFFSLIRGPRYVIRIASCFVRGQG